MDLECGVNAGGVLCAQGRDQSCALRICRHHKEGLSTCWGTRHLDDKNASVMTACLLTVKNTVSSSREHGG